MIYNDYDLIITNNYIKEEILKEVSNNECVLKPKIITKQELRTILEGNVSNDSLYYLMKAHNLDFNNASLILKHIYFHDEYYRELIDKDLIYKLNNFNYKNILVINEYIDHYLIKLMNNANIHYVNDEINNKNLIVNEFNDIEEEVYFVASKIFELLKNNVDINKIKLINVSSNYNNIINKIFNFFNIPINLNDSYMIYKTNDVSLFFKTLSETFDIDESLKVIKNDNIYKKIINILNNYNFDIIDELVISIIKEDLKKIKIKDKRYKNAVECISIKEVYSKDNYYFFMNFNEKEFPTLYKDDDYFNDLIKQENGLFTSVEKNVWEKELFINVLNKVDNITLSYKLNDYFNEYYPSYLVDDLNMVVIKDHNKNYNYSNKYNEIMLSTMLDNFINYNKKDYNLKLLYFNYKDLLYKKYDNKYGSIDKDLYINKIKKPTLSYSSVNNFYLCGFKYYLTNILYFDDFEDNINIIIGNMFHKILEKIYDKDFAFEREFNNFIKGYEDDRRTSFFLKLLKEELSFVVDTIFKLETNTNLKNVLNEEKVVLDLGDFNLKGYIDKVLYENINGELVAIVIDYKTGSVNTNLQNISDGLNLQLPIYAYLLKNKNPDYKIGGFYYQELLHNYAMDEKIEDREKSLKLQGYSINEAALLKEIDSSYVKSNMIRSMSLTQEGRFNAHAKVLSEDDIKTLLDLVDEKLKEAADKILNREFDINPKRLDNKNISCQFCNFKDICFYKEEDVINLDKKTLKDTLK